jgi:hypothetical protein
VIEQFIEKNFRAESLVLIEQANDILAEYEAQDFTLSLRQLYYQFVARGIIPNTERSYKNLGGLVTDARMAGLMDWDAIEDRNRSISGWLIEEDIDNLLRELPRNYAVDMWANQNAYVEVWVEKDALSSIVQRACNSRRVPFLACKGYLSASEAYRAAKRFENAGNAGKELHLIHLGDHDPSGLDMTRDNRDRVEQMSWNGVEVNRIALNRDQIDRYRPPPNPAKVTDSRADAYIAEHGYTSWELDALEPSVIVQLIHEAVEPMVDEDQWADDLAREREQKDLLRGVAQNWDGIEELIRESWEDR